MRHLPNEWRETVDPASGRVYYFHEKTKETRWTAPTAPLAQYSY